MNKLLESIKTGLMFVWALLVFILGGIFITLWALLFRPKQMAARFADSLEEGDGSGYILYYLGLVLVFSALLKLFAR